MSVPLPVLGLDLRDQDVLTLLTMCLWGEARNQPEAGIIGVAWVIRNRVVDGRYGETWKDVMLAPKQFSCFLAGDPNLRKMMEPEQYGTLGIWNRCAAVAEGVYRGDIPSNVGRATHYHSVRKPKAARRWPPLWAGSMRRVAVIGDHIFYEAQR